MKNLLLFLIVLGVMVRCQRKQDLLPENYPNLLITRISFPGIPDKNVTIDWPNRIIYVKMPAFLPSANLIPTIVLSEDAKLSSTESLENFNEFNNWIIYDKPILKIDLNGKTYPNQFVSYTIQPEAAAPLSITQSKALPAYAIGDSSEIYVDVQNLYGNSFPKSAILVNKKTGNKLTLTGGNMSAYPFLNRLTIRITSLELEPGEYDISLGLANGNSLKISQPLTVIRGKSKIVNPWFAAEAGKTITALGSNLFAGEVAFRLLLINGSSLPLTADFALNEKSATLQLPVSLAPGYYGIEMISNGRPLGVSHRLVILRYANQPCILGLLPAKGGSIPRDYPSTEPVILPRTQTIYIMSGGVEKTGKNFFVLINEANATSTYRFPINLAEETAPSFTVSSDIPAGRYKAVIQEIDPATKEITQQSEPFERPIVLQ